ncbi:methyltransferase domain-containing protein [Formosa sp. 4Alg 33]|uniref:methyltransferase domain-containing protein n=1 Tax=Formosa sp. 4Alg 33 TaxID=3382189 RepID=UPI003D9C4E77
MRKEYVYSEYTYNSKNVIARFSHRKRFSIAIKLVLEKEFNSILDYGAGDNKFLTELNLKRDNLNLFAFEPIMEITPPENIQVFRTLTEFENKKFDVITCFETLEHFNECSQSLMLKEFSDRLNTDGKVIISVPIEIGFVSLIKNMRRVTIGEHSYKYVRNSIKCFFGKQIPEIRNLDGFIDSHLGFNHKRLEKLMLKYFQITKIENSPFKSLSDQFNSQVFYILEKKKTIVSTL